MRPLLTLFSALALLAGCGPSPVSDEAAARLDAEERFFVEQYLRAAEARRLALQGAPGADSLYARLAAELPVDSVMEFAARVSRERPERWRPIFQEIERRLEQP